MKKKSLSIWIWIALALAIFSVFRWLFGIALPGAALAFAIGITVILMTGLISGWYTSTSLFQKEQKPPGRGLLIVLFVFVIAAFIGVGLLVNSMIGETTFFRFSMTILLLFLISACTSAIVSLIRTRIRFQLQLAESVSAQSTSELQLLQSRLSPHFLFNTLNNMYGISISDPPKIPELLLKLSDLLRYSVYETKELYVPLQNEIDYLKNYIEFEKIRLGDRLELNSNLHLTSGDHLKISPMLLVVFLENAFKHSRNSGDQNIYIEIDLQKSSDAIEFTVKNSYDRSQTMPPKKHSGLGLETVKKRLALLYTNRHSLKITESGNLFIVHLSLNTQ